MATLRVKYGSVNLYSNTVAPKMTPQSEAIPFREEDMIANNAGGFGFKLDKWKMLDRFLMLGSEGGTYYVGEHKLTMDNVKNVLACIKENGPRVVARVIEVSDKGLAYKNDPALFALALAAKKGDEQTRKAAYFALPKVARIGTHLFHFLQFVEAAGGGWGRGLKRAVSNWYLDRKADSLAYQVAKYQSRDGWSHADALRLAHPKTEDKDKNSIFKWVLGSELKVREASKLPRVILGMDLAKNADTESEVCRLISEYNLDREMIPTQFLNKPEVQMALLEKGMPMTALVRNLGNLSKSGLLVKGNYAVINKITEQLNDEEAIKKARIHPLGVLLALKTYAGGAGFRGSGTWKVVPDIKDALDGMFYKAFQNVEPIGQRIMLGLDVSGSMQCGEIGGTNITPIEAVGAMAMITYKTEKNANLMAFSHKLVPVNISRLSRLEDVVQHMSAIPVGGTDCSLPIVYAAKNKIPVDLFVVYTDNETWAGNIHPSQALKGYRANMGIPAKLVVVGMTATDISIADPKDTGMLDVAGFDASIPALLRGFALGEF